ncbi:MAG TPA: SDR family oxidoreductase [Candidatus Hydrogenedentes bacterium]|nr:SDR family oxidoreductase [Candidatus Hydrogenedentota bacterium]HOV74660.1 SDR family oxidoreductase [Candidatus Hydrogenedentota bacterium]HPC15554.1 SDR family oxidoreductase [Candidatus Hydrogenedentota bacterium]HRT19374.1 SDR family oxidoreductase [Candidatus Hydrogenedentota bacterium]HRT63892.1 SDR family oxidoreductase [Candidatus Hydrogenedentota bacterium]
MTGAGKRIGRAVALTLAREGVHVVVHYRSSETEARETAADARDQGVRAWTLPGDLGNPRTASDLFGQAVALAGPIDYLINSASSFLSDRLAVVTPEAFYDAVNLNALAPFLLGRCLAAQKRPGGIVNLLDARIADYDREHASYHLSKRLLFTLTRMMAVEFAPCVRVNGIAPGLILPPEGKDESYLAQLAATNPLNRYGSPDDVAEAVLYLLRSDFVTGQVIFVDGGRHMRGGMYGC